MMERVHQTIKFHSVLSHDILHFFITILRNYPFTLVCHWFLRWFKPLAAELITGLYKEGNSVTVIKELLWRPYLLMSTCYLGDHRKVLLASLCNKLPVWPAICRLVRRWARFSTSCWSKLVEMKVLSQIVISSFLIWRLCPKGRQSRIGWASWWYSWLHKPMFCIAISLKHR